MGEEESLEGVIVTVRGAHHVVLRANEIAEGEGVALEAVKEIETRGGAMDVMRAVVAVIDTEIEGRKIEAEVGLRRGADLLIARRKQGASRRASLQVEVRQVLL